MSTVQGLPCNYGRNTYFGRMLLTAIAIDDEPDAVELIGILAEKVPFLTLKATFTNAFTAIAWLQQNKVDLIFLDIKMPDINGIDLLNSLTAPPMVVFTTAYSEHAVEGFELNAIDYLLKPFSSIRFLKACNKALEIKTMRGGEALPYIFVKTGYQEEKVMLSDIKYLEADGNYVTYVLADRNLLCRQSLTEALNTLPQNTFVRVHRSYVVATAYITKTARFEIYIDDKLIPVGESYMQQVAELRSSLRK